MKPTPLTDQIALDTRVEFGSIEKLLASHRSLERDRAELIEALRNEMLALVRMQAEGSSRLLDWKDGTRYSADRIRALLSRLGADK